jgi:hypothetical protein
MAFETHLRNPRPITEIIADLANQSTKLLRKESQLVRTEMSEKIGQAAFGLAFILVGAVLLIPALVILLEAAVAALIDAGLESYWSSLIVGGGAFIVGLILLMIGVSRVKARNLVPSKTIHQIQRDADVAKRQVRQDNDIQRAA